MPLHPDIIANIAHELEIAERDRVQRRQISLDYPDMTIDDAYAVQHAWMALKASQGRKVIGYKIGLTSKAMQRASSISEPDTGVLLDDMRIESGATLEASRFIEPRIEVELSFLLKSDLPASGCTIKEVLEATDYVIPALELIDARVPRIDPDSGKTRKVFDTISDNAANGAIILGTTKVKPDSVDLKWVSALLYRNGDIEESGVAAAVLGHPANGIVWLANQLATQGETLRAGQIVLAGSFTAPVPAQAGDCFVADYGPLGLIEVNFI
jgi:2-oxo-hept-3-ene-1,7-dioate hydratase